MNDDTHRAIEARLREALRAEADRCAATEPRDLATRCAAIPAAGPAPTGHRNAWAWAAGLAAAAAALVIALRPSAPPSAPPATDTHPLAVPATEAQLARLHASIPRPPPVIRPPQPPRLVVNRLAPPPHLTP
jgi:hypothetical protein